MLLAVVALRQLRPRPSGRTERAVAGVGLNAKSPEHLMVLRAFSSGSETAAGMPKILFSKS
jgi:hypothetical protein